VPTTTITTIRTVAIPANDQDATTKFFTDRLGFVQQFDAELNLDSPMW
jgi:catechol 2,3-dioxygenase-like lactoylglutathione lyase family enzyme